MYIINVIPLIRIPHPNPQILSYFFSKKLDKGALARISLRKKQVNAIVFSSENLEKKKIDIKKGISFKLKPIEKVVSKEPVLTKNQFKLLFWMSEYYFAPLGMVARIFLSKKPFAFANLPASKAGASTDIQKLILTPETKGLVFSAFNNLKSIIIENADSPKYKSWGRRPYYNAKDIAIQLAKIHKAKLILKKEFNENCKLKIENSIIDMREEMRNNNFSIISRALKEKLKKAKKSILFISRRGAATFILCRDCGYVIKCPRCDVPMILHHVRGKLLCHHCNNEEKPPALCPNCKGYRIKYFGAGTQRVEIEVKKLFPKVKIFRLDSDTAKSPTQQQEIINKFNKLKNAILIGTQMLLEKDIKQVNLVGIVSIETILNLPDYRSSERVFQIISQLKSMSDRGFLVQTYNPENAAIKNAIDNKWQKFYDEEIKIRKTLNYPPFSQIIKLTFEHRDSQKAQDEAKILLEKLKQQIQSQSKIENYKLKIDLLGPVPAFIPKIAGKHRWNIIIKSKIKNLKQRNKLLIIVPSTWKIEVDPESLL